MNIVCIGAHPDDCEFFVGGTALKWARRGDHVLFVSLTNGEKGHYAMSPDATAARRLQEAQKSAELAGVDSLVLNYPDGELLPTLELRRTVVDVIRNQKADLVLTHRPNDYHPDHRYSAQIVQDAAFMVTVPGFFPKTSRLEKNPIFLHFQDFFQKPTPFCPDIAVRIDDVVEEKWGMLNAMESQVYEWLPWLDKRLQEVPVETEKRFQWLKDTWSPYFLKATDTVRHAIKKRYGDAKGQSIRFAESFEVCEYGSMPTEDELNILFPW